MIKTKRSWLVTLAVLGTALLVVTFLLYDTLFPLFLAFALAYAFSPLIDYMEGRGIARQWGVSLLLLALALVFILILAVIVPVLIHETSEFVQKFPDYLDTALRQISNIAAQFGVRIPAGQDEMLARLRTFTSKLSVATITSAFTFTKGFLFGAGNVLVKLLQVLIIPVFFFYFLRDLPKIRKYIYELIPPRKRPYAKEKFHEIDLVLSGYIRGQMVVATILAIVFAIALPIIGVPFGVFIGMAAGLLNIIPYVGQLSGFAVSLLMVFVDFQGWWQLVAIPVLFGTMNFIEGTFITPKIVGNKVGLSPVVSIISLIIGGEVAGFMGMLVAIPAAGIIKIFLKDFIARYRASDLYEGSTSHSK